MNSTAIVFASNQIQLIQLDIVKKQVVGSAYQALPHGLIHRGKIVNSKELDQVLSGLLAKCPVYPKSAVVVIPEEGVFSKSLVLPVLPDHEIDEAVRWEAESYLPYALATAVLDWEMLSDKDSLHILFQAIPQDIVDDYIFLLQQKGIQAVAIETPALAMVRLTENKPGTRLLIHVSPYEATLTLARDKEVVATSIIPVTQQIGSMIRKTILHMMSYYRNFRLEGIQIGGMGVSTQLVEELKQLNLPLTGFAAPFPVKAEIFNGFMLAFSAALNSLDLPQSQQTINLLPDWYVTNNQKQTQTKFWTRLLGTVALFGVVLLIGVGGVYGWLVKEEQMLKRQHSQSSGVRKEAMEQAGTTNQLSKLAVTLATTDYFPLKTTAKIQNLSPDKVRLAKLQLAVSEKKGVVMGMANDRLAMLAFKQDLEELPEVTNVILPVSSFVEEVNIPFQLNFTLSKEFEKEESKKDTDTSHGTTK